MNNFLKNVEHDRYNIDDITYKTFICKDCTKKNKEFELHINDESPKDLLNFGYISLQYLENPFVYVTTPPMVCLFGVDKNTWNMSLQFKDLNTDNVMKSFYDFIQGIEFQQMQYLNLDEDDADLYNSQIRQDKDEKYDPYLIVKVPFRHNKYEVDILNKDNSYQSIQNIYNFTKMRCDIFIDKIWKYNEKYVCKWKIKKIVLV